MRFVLRDRVRLVGEQGRHLRRRLEVEVVRLEAHPVGLLDHRPGAHAQQRVVSLVLLPVDVVEVVGDDQRQAHLGAQAQQLLVQPALVGDLVVLELQEEAVGAQDVRVRARDPPGADSQSSVSSARATSPLRHADSPMSPALCWAR